MAINIFQGGKSSNSRANSASATSRAAAAKDALAVPSVTSSSGATAVGTNGTLGKVGNTVGKIAGVAAKFLPGVGGLVAKGLSNVLNDPEWWQSVPGDAVTLNQPLRPIPTSESVQFRPAIMEFAPITGGDIFVIEPTDTMVTQYLLPQVRKVVNAVPLQEMAAYKQVLKVNATIYAYWRTAKKIKFMLTHGQPYLASMNVTLFPYFQTENSAALDALINRCEEYLRSNVRLPHTLCEYLAWRFGRVYHTSDSAKASLVLYNAFSIAETVAAVNGQIAQLMNLVASSAPAQAANSDMFNAYYDHDLFVEVRDDTQFTFDRKEFALRTNLDLYATTDSQEPNPVYIDSNLDNQTAFMASTVSTIGAGVDGERSQLFPVHQIRFYIPLGTKLAEMADPRSVTYAVEAPSDYASNPEYAFYVAYEDATTRWAIFNWVRASRISPNSSANDLSKFMIKILVAKAMELYNKDLLATYFVNDNTHAGNLVLDVTAPTYDMALVPDLTIGQEHVYAFANLVDIERKHSMSYKAAEKLVAKETAELVDKIDVATAATPAAKSGATAK